jgi:dTMP kinase
VSRRRPGRLVTIEGGEGAGKSTLARALAARLAAIGIDHTVTREPGGAAGAEAIRELLLGGADTRWAPTTEALLFAAARHEHVRQLIRPALGRGALVLCDRFTDSTRAYQGDGHGLSGPMLDRLARIAVGRLRPHLTLILDVAPEVGLARARGRAGGGDRVERLDLDFHRRVAAGFHRIAAAEPDRCRLLDARLAPDALAARAWDEIERMLGRAG